MNKNLGIISALLILAFSSLFAEAKQMDAPRLRIRVAQYADSLEFVLPEGGRWHSDNRSGNIPAGKKCRITGKLFRKALKKYHVMVASVPADDIEKLTQTLNKFNKMGYKTHKFTVGQTPKSGFPDNRMVLIGVGIFEQESDAQKLHEELSACNISSWIFVETIASAKGQLQLTVAEKTIPFKFSKIRLEGKKGVTLLNAEYAKGFSWHGHADRTYKSSIEIRFGSDNSLVCIEHTDLESLLVGIVPSEISAKAPPAALQAQAIAARSEIIAKMGTRHFNEGYEFCSEQHCQVYKGMQSCDEYIYNSIAETWGMVLLDHKNKALDTVYSANCGGHTSANQNIWTSEPNPHLQGIADTVSEFRADLTDERQIEEFIRNPPQCWCSLIGVEGSDKFRWSKKISEKDWHKVEKSVGLGRIKGIGSFVRDVSGRIISLKITCENGEKTIMKELAIRKLFGMLPSSCFVANWKTDPKGFIISAEFSGAGWGHGVGMCQTGAQNMARQGKNFKEILLHYFPGARIKKLY